MLCQSECACLHKTINMVVFFVKSNKIPIQKGEHSCKCTELFLKRKEGIELICLVLLSEYSLWVKQQSLDNDLA